VKRIIVVQFANQKGHFKMKNIITGVKIKPTKPKEMRVSNSFNRLKGESDFISPEQKKVGSIKKKYPIYIAIERATYFTKRKLKGIALQKYIDAKIEHYNAKFNLSCKLKVNNKNRKPIVMQEKI
jgi:hypothetical protein